MGFESILSITELNSYVKKLLNSQEPLQDLWVRGEVSNFMQHRSGHCYFTLKDESSQITCTMFKNHGSLLKFKLEDGLRVIARGNLDLYLPRGQYQLNILFAVPDGLGALHLAYEQLKRKLEKEGFFARKRALPKFPEKIGIATSPDGEALRDMLAVIERRNPNVVIYFCSTTVQGRGAVESISRSIELLNSIEDIDVIIVGRGGGLIENLWAFNEEAVARAIYNSRVPVVSAVGHEGDFTISDLVADFRASTPSAAAEIVVPDRKMLLKEIAVLEYKLYSAMKLTLYKLHKLIREEVVKLDPKHLQLNRFYQKLDELLAKLQFLIEYQIEKQSEKVAAFIKSLHALNPLKILERGYCLALKEGKIVRSRGEVKLGDCLRILLSDGEIICRVEEEVSVWNLNIGS